MEMIDEMRKLLHEKKACFLQYEEETCRIASQECREAEEFEAGIAARQRLIEEIDGIDERLKAMKNFSAEGERLFEISKNRWDFRNPVQDRQTDGTKTAAGVETGYLPQPYYEDQHVQ